MKSVYCLCFLFLCTLQLYSADLGDSSKWIDNFIKETINVQKNHQKTGFQTTAYLKNTLILDQNPHTLLGKKVAKYVRWQDKQLIWLYESLSDLYYTPESGYKELIRATKSFGKYPSWEFKSAEQLQVDFTQNEVKFEALSDKSFVSPLARNNFHYYTFSHVKTVGNLVYVGVKAKRKHNPTFEGELLIDQKTRKVVSLNLVAAGAKGINFIDSLRIIQKFDLNRNCPISTKFIYHGDVLNFTFSGTSEAYFNNYKSLINPPDFFEKKEIVKDDSSGYHQELFKGNRAVPLTLQQRLSYEYQDDKDLERYNKENIIDSLDRAKKKKSLFPLLFSDLIWKSENSKRAVIFQPIAPAFFFNTVEGLGINYGLTYFKYTNKGKYWSVTPKVRYGISNKELNSDVSLSWLYQPEKRGIFNFSAGSTYRDLNPNGSLSSLQNTINTIFFQQNFLKLYRKEYVSMGLGREIRNSLYFSFGFEFSRNFSVENMTDYTFNDIKNKNFTSNNPLNPIFQSKLFPDHNAFFLNASLIYTVNQPFIKQDGEKIYKLPKGPRFILNFRKGIPQVFKSESDYNFVDLEMQHEKLDMGLWGYGSYSISGGKFFNAQKVYYPEWKHFIGNSSLVFNSGLKSFHLLDFYTFSTNEYFAEAHFEHNFNTLFSNKIPLLRALKLQELLGGAYLYQPVKESYYEIYVGLRRLMFRADYALSFDKSGKLNQGFKISYNF
ncbi:MAG: DUF5686 family protein [Pelobium sp.]